MAVRYFSVLGLIFRRSDRRHPVQIQVVVSRRLHEILPASGLAIALVDMRLDCGRRVGTGWPSWAPTGCRARRPSSAGPGAVQCSQPWVCAQRAAESTQTQFRLGLERSYDTSLEPGTRCHDVTNRPLYCTGWFTVPPVDQTADAHTGRGLCPIPCIATAVAGRCYSAVSSRVVSALT